MSDHAEVAIDEIQKTQADPETAERFISEKHIGDRIRRLRLKKRYLPVINSRRLDLFQARRIWRTW